MLRRFLTPCASLALVALALTGCTGSGSAPASSDATVPSPISTPTSTPATPTGTVPTSATATCSASTTTLTFAQHHVLTSGLQVGFAPGSRVTTPRHLPVVQVVHAAAPGLGSGSGLTAAVGRHWHVTTARLGQSSTRLDANSRVTVPAHHLAKHNGVVVVYRSATVFTGQFASVCGGRRVSGHYTTFGPIATTVADCHGGHPGALERQARRQFC